MYKINEWKEKILEKNDVKSYKHIDRKIDIRIDKDFELVKTTLEDLNNHQFLPFIKRTEITSRYKRGKCSCGNLKKDEACLMECGYRSKAKKSKVRPIMYSSHLDSLVYSYYNFILSEAYEKKLSNSALGENVTAYRKIPLEEGSKKGKCNIHFAKESFDYIVEKGDCSVITSDISGFFDNLDHRLLLKSIKKVAERDSLDKLYKIYKSVTRYHYINYYLSFNKPEFRDILKKSRYKIYSKIKEHTKKNRSNKGIPQGSPISGLLSNIYMYDFDREIVDKYPDVFYRRYSDDILIVCDQNKVEEIQIFLFNLINESLLEIQPEKTNMATFRNGICVDVVDGSGEKMRRKYVDYLGFEFYGDKILMRKKSFNKQKGKQERKVKKRVHNTSYQSKSGDETRNKVRRSDYLKKTQVLFRTGEIIKQIKTLSRSRNKKRKIAASKKRDDEK
jgi:hypothetical protein